MRNGAFCRVAGLTYDPEHLATVAGCYQTIHGGEGFEETSASQKE